MTSSKRWVVPTRVGRADRGDNRFYGFRVNADLVGMESFAGITAMAISGRRVPAEHVPLLDAFAVFLTLAEPRIWPLKIARLASAYGGMVPGLVAGNLCFHGASVGHLTTGNCAVWLSELHDAVVGVDEASAVERFVLARLERRERLIGYGVPFRPEDERMVALGQVLERHDRLSLPHWRLHVLVSRIVRERKGIEPNIGAGLAAALLDMDFRPPEIGPLVLALGQQIFFANAFEGAHQAPELLRSLPDECVEYAGRAPRVSPRALRAAR